MLMDAKASWAGVQEVWLGDSRTLTLLFSVFQLSTANTSACSNA